MKYLIALVILFTPFLVKADTVFGFMNGNFYDISGNLKYACLMDGSCYDYATQGMTTLSQILGLSTSTPQTITITPQSNPQSVPQPTPLPQPISQPQLPTTTNTTIIPPSAGEPTAPSCTITITYGSDGYSANWTSQGVATSTPGVFYSAKRISGGIPDFSYGNQNGGYPINSLNGSLISGLGPDEIIFGKNVVTNTYYAPQLGDVVCIGKYQP